MKIKRFNEANEQLDISSERIDEIVEKLKDHIASIEEKNKFVESLLSELDNYKSQSSKGNDQIDDSISALQVVKSNLDGAVDKLDTVMKNLTDYNDGGRKYLYSENEE